MSPISMGAFYTISLYSNAFSKMSVVLFLTPLLQDEKRFPR